MQNISAKHSRITNHISETHFSIIGTGSAVPELTVTNTDLAEFIDTNDEWIRTRTGICERHILGDKESLLSLATTACRRAINMSGISPAEIDLVVCCTVGGDYVSPALSCLVASELGLRSDCFTIDNNMGCCGFVYGLRIADSFFESHKAHHALVFAAEGLSRMLDWNDRSTCCLFGDAAGAVVLKADDRQVQFVYRVNGSAEHLGINRPGDNCRYNTYTGQRAVFMDGQEIYKFAVLNIGERIQEILEDCSLSTEDISLFLLHQANLRIIKSAVSRLGVDQEKVPHNIEKYGNTSSASIAVLLDELNRAGKITRGDKLVLCAFGAGLTSIAALITF